MRQVDITTLAEVEAIISVYPKNLSGRTILTLVHPADGCMVSNIEYTTSILHCSPVPTIQPVLLYTINRLHVQSATHHNDLLQWWCRPVSAVQSDGHRSTPDTLCRSIHWVRACPPVISASTTLLRSQVEVLPGFSQSFFSSKSAAELCLVPSTTTAGKWCVSCAPSNADHQQTTLFSFCFIDYCTTSTSFISTARQRCAWL